MRLTFALLFSLAAVGAAQPLSYTLLGSEGAQPSPRFDGTIAYDPASRQIFLFGGSDGLEKNDLWSYSLGQRRWTEVQVSGERPPARFGHTLLYDSVRRRLIVFGGQARGFFSDTWAFDIATGVWRQLAGDETGPSRRYGHSAIYDAARDRMIVSHGFTNAGRFDDTWAFDLASNSWRDVSPASGRPLRRCLHHAVYDAGNNQMLLYGGCASGFGPCPLGDLWAFDLSAHRWTEVTPSLRPAPRDHYGIVFDATRRRVLLFGGSGPLNDTWSYDPSSRTWREVELTGPPPSPRSRHESAYASDRGNAFFFGGVTSTGPTSELWMLGPGFILAGPQVTREAVVNAFSNVPGPLAPGELISIYGAGLSPDPLVTFDGTPATILYADAGQINVRVPIGLPTAGETNLAITVNGTASPLLALPVASASPGLFPLDRSLVVPAGGIVTLYATGQGVDPAVPLAVTIGGKVAEILFRGETAGVLQVNARVPDDATPGEASVSISVGGAESQPGVIIVIGPHL